jgi:predicted LPLAT superfamily acyltransferase
MELVADEVHLERKQRNEALARYAGIYAKLLESYTRSAPLNWFNFYDFWSKA